MDEQLAYDILRAAIEEGRAGELLDCLFNGGSCTIDATTGLLVLADNSMIHQLMGKD